MSQAHRPTWNPTQGRETKAGSRQVSKLSLPQYTKLKFRQPGQTSSSEVLKRDLKAELAEAERKAIEKKRKAAGLPDFEVANNGALRIEGQEDGKKRRVEDDDAELDLDLDEDKDDESDDEGVKGGVDKGKGKAVDVDQDKDEDEDEDEDDEDSDDDDSDDEDETAALMAELAKIKQERAEEKARQDAESSAKSAADRDQEIATGNPLLNLQNALGQSPAPSSTGTSTASFSVKRRWDDDLIFKNQAAGLDDKPKKGEFVNDLLRSEFHKKFMLKFIK